MDDTPAQEWIPLRLPADLFIGDTRSLGVECERVTVDRDERSCLILTATGAGPGPSFQDGEAGKSSVTFDFDLGTSSYQEARATGFVPTSSSGTLRGTTQQTTVSGPLRSLTVDYSAGTPACVVEWLFNAPSCFFWTRATERVRQVTFERTREGEAIHLPVARNKSGGRDHLRVDLDLPTLSSVRFGVVDGKIHSAVGSVSRPGFLQLAAGPDGLPAPDLRYTVRFALNFLFGCGLGPLGSSEFDAEHFLLRTQIISSFSPGGDREAAPIIMDASSAMYIDEEFCREFLLAYIQHEAVYDLNRVVWLLRYSLTAPIDMAAAYAGAAFEILRTKFYAQPANEARSRKLPRGQWKSLRSALDAVISQFVGAAASAPQHEEGGPGSVMTGHGLEAVRRSLDTLNNVSGTRLNKQLLDDLGLAHGAAEEAALMARNDAAHGNPFAEKDAGEWLARVDALRTLTSRALVAVLGLKPPGYIDYGSSGKNQFPARAWGDAQHLRGC